MVAGVERCPADHQGGERVSPSIAVALAGGPEPFGLDVAPRTVREDQRGARQARQPSQPERLRILGRFLDIERPLQIAAQQGGHPRPEPRGRRQGRGRLAAVGDGVQVPAGLVELPGQQADHADGQGARCFRQLTRQLLGSQRIVRDRLAQQAGPIVARHGGRLQPPGQGLALAGTDEARIAGSKHMLGALVGLDRFAPASLGPVAAGTPEHQPRVLAKECRRQRVDPGPRPFQQLAALVVDEPVNRLPVLTPRIGLHRLWQRAAPFQQRPRSAIGGARLDLTELFHQHLLEVRAQHLVVTVAAAIIGGRRKDLAAFELLQQLLAPTAFQEGVAERPGEARHDAGPNQEPAQIGRQLVEDIAGQILSGQPRARPQRGEDSTPFQRRLPGRGEVKQLQPGGPTLGAARQLSELFRRQGFTIEITEQTFDLPGAKPQVLAADFQQRP